MDKQRGYERFGAVIRVPYDESININIDELGKQRLAFEIGKFIMENIDELPIKIDKGINAKYRVTEYRVSGILISEEKLRGLLGYGGIKDE